MKKTMSRRTRGIWAVDPFETSVLPDLDLARKLDLQPVHVLASDLADPTLPVGQTIHAAEKATESYVQGLGVQTTRAAQVVLVKPGSRQEETAALLRLAAERGVDCFVVSSHGRSGVQRWLLGSFAENLLRASSLPVLFLTQSTTLKTSDALPRALFATDFTPYSKKAFLKFVPVAARLGLDLTIFHSVSLPSSILASSYGVPVVIPEVYFSSQLEWARQEGAAWVALAESHGVRARTIIRDEAIGPNLSQSILSAAENEKAALVALASVSGPAAAAVLGSVAREVFRAKRCPVWVYGPEALTAEKSRETLFLEAQPA